MRTFDRYLLLQLLMLFGFFSLVLVGVFWVNRAISVFDQLIAGGSNVSLFLEFTVLSLPNVIVRVLPVAGLVATIYGLNRMTADSEIIVARTTGLSPWAMARPVAVFGVIVAIMISILTHLLVPGSVARLGERNAALSDDITARFLKPGEFQHPAPGITVYVRDVTADGVLLGVFLQDRRSEGMRTTYTAERAFLVRDNTNRQKMVMFEGMAQTLRKEGRNLTIITFEDFSYDLTGLVKGTPAVSRNPDALSTRELLQSDPADITRDHTTREVYLHTAHTRFSDAILGFVAPLLAVACMMLGGFARTGLWKQILLAVVCAIALQLLSNTAEREVLENADKWPLLYLPGCVGLLVAAGLLASETRPRWRSKRGYA